MNFNFLKECKGVIQVGSSIGQEIPLFKENNLKAILIEPLPLQFKILSKVAAEAKYDAYNRLITDVDDKEYEFKVSNYNGKSSSILQLNNHPKMWPHVRNIEIIKLKSITLSTLLKGQDIQNYDCLYLDTQGSELLVLKGALAILNNFKYILTEAADFEMYKGCCQVKDLQEFLECRGFLEADRSMQKTKEGVGICWDILYKRRLL